MPKPAGNLHVTLSLTDAATPALKNLIGVSKLAEKALAGVTFSATGLSKALGTVAGPGLLHRVQGLKIGAAGAAKSVSALNASFTGMATKVGNVARALSTLNPQLQALSGASAIGAGAALAGTGGHSARRKAQSFASIRPRNKLGQWTTLPPGWGEPDVVPPIAKTRTGAGGGAGGRGRSRLLPSGLRGLGFAGSSALLGVGGLIGGPLGIAAISGGLLGYAGVRNISAVQSATADISGITQAPGSATALLRQQALHLGAQTPLTPRQYLQIQLGAARAGIPNQQIRALTPSVGKLHLATKRPIEELTNFLAATGHQFGLKSTKQYQSVVDALMYSASRTITTPKVLTQGMQYMGIAGRMLDLSPQESIAMMASQKGFRGGLSVRGIRSLTTSLMNYGQRSDEFKRYGINIYDSKGERRDQMKVLGEMASLYRSSTDKDASSFLKLFTGEREMAILFKAWPKVQSLIKGFEMHGTGFTEKVYGAKAGTIERSHQMFGAKWEDAMVKGVIPRMAAGIWQLTVDAGTKILDVMIKDTPSADARLKRLLPSIKAGGMKHLAGQIMGINPSEVTYEKVQKHLTPTAIAKSAERTISERASATRIKNLLAHGKFSATDIVDPNVMRHLDPADVESIMDVQSHKNFFQSLFYGSLNKHQAVAFSQTRSLQKHPLGRSFDVRQYGQFGNINLKQGQDLVSMLGTESFYNFNPKQQDSVRRSATLIAQDRVIEKHEASAIAPYIVSPQFVSADPQTDGGGGGLQNIIAENVGVQATNVYITGGDAGQVAGQTF